MQIYDDIFYLIVIFYQSIRSFFQIYYFALWIVL